MSQRTVMAAGFHGTHAEELPHARRCAWCDPPHWVTTRDAALDAHGARTTHGMCEVAEARVNAQLAKASPDGT